MASESYCEFSLMALVSSASFGFVLTIYLLQCFNCAKTLPRILNIKGNRPHWILNELNEEIAFTFFLYYLVAS